MLSDAPNAKVITKASTDKEATLLAKQRELNAIFTNIRTPSINGVATTQKIISTHPDIKIIALTSCTEEPFTINILKAGARAT